MIIVNAKQKSFDFSNSLEFVNVVDVNDIDEIAFENEQCFVVIRIIDDIEYFDSIYENDKNNSIVNVDRHIYYRDVFTFVDKLKNLKKILLTRVCVSSSFFAYEMKFWYNISSKLLIWKKIYYETFRWSNNIEH